MNEFYDYMNDLQLQIQERENVFFRSKMNLITKEIYDFVSGLSRGYYSKERPVTNECSQQQIDNWFKPPIFFISKNVRHKPFYVFQKRPDSFDQQLMQNPDTVPNYVKSFVSCLDLLFSEYGFFKFIITDANYLETFEKIICSDFTTKCDETNIELFKQSSFLELPRALFCHGTFNEILKYLIYKNGKFAPNAQKMKEIILSYLKKASAISPEIIASLLCDDNFYQLFKDDNEIEQIIIDAIGKTYFTPGTLFYDGARGTKNCLKEFDEIIRELAEANQKYITRENSVQLCKQAIEGYDETKVSEMRFFYNEKKDRIQPALINRLVDILSNEKTNQYIDLEDLFYVYPNVAEFMLSHCQENKESESSVNLFNGLKTWLEYRMNDYRFYKLRNNFKKIIFESKSLLELFTLNDELKKTFVAVFNRAIKEDVDLHYALLGDKEHAKNINSFLSTFEINLDNTEMSHCNDVKDLLVEIILIAICIFATICSFVMIPIFWPKLFVLIFFFFAYKRFRALIKICKRIEKDRIYNAMCDINKSKTKEEAKNRIPFDMLWRTEVKYYFNQLPELENSPDEIITNS